MFDRIPKWVKNFPYELDRAALVALAKSSKDPFDRPREMNFMLYGLKNEDIESATHYIERKGWKCSSYPQDDDPGRYVLEAQKLDYVMSQEDYINDTAFFNRVADLYKARCDGWYASN